MAKKYAYQLREHPVDYGVELMIKDLQIDVEAQRTLGERRAQSMASTWVHEARGTLIVSKREDGSYFLVDGQHRKRAMELLKIEKTPCEVHHGLTQTEEAILFLIKNRESSKPNAIDEYKIGLTGGIPLFVDTEQVLKEKGLQVGATSTNSVGAVAGILRITETYGPEVLKRTLDVAEEAWGRTAETWDGMLLGGLGMFLGKHSAQVNAQTNSNSDLAKRLGKHGPAWKWKSNVHALSTHGGTTHSGTGGRVSVCYGEIVKVWNKSRRSVTTKIPTD
ncbi:ParB/Srx family N-terminal domain-containing protein [Nocardia sp. NRRL WC-3656]|uniref:ParB/Srx family N-terminal domain-containing protein n=1 Tax=Nocardia sp. NRRL WC-3656 TaxID=1463824 RepID=UPI0004C2C519|nr:ParB/Srx family N-terminal domain-containing protein [Nocardia sp. NRRL WC-3656]